MRADGHYLQDQFTHCHWSGEDNLPSCLFFNFLWKIVLRDFNWISIKEFLMSHRISKKEFDLNILSFEFYILSDNIPYKSREKHVSEEDVGLFFEKCLRSKCPNLSLL